MMLRSYRAEWQPRRWLWRSACLTILLTLAAASVSGAAPPPGRGGEKAAGPPEEEVLARLRPEHRKWLEEVEPILSAAEREAFLALAQDYQRASFIRRFWEVRDPFPETGRNELRDAWEQRLEAAKANYDSLEDGRARTLLLYGEPTQIDPVRCPDVLQPLEVWTYGGSLFVRGTFTLVLVRQGGRDQYRLWSPHEGLHSLLAFTVRTGLNEREIIERISTECFRGDRLLLELESLLDWTQIEHPVPQPSDEWVQTFLAASTDLPEGVESFSAELEVGFPGRRQSRTALQGVIRVSRGEVEPSEIDGGATFNLLLDGEIVRRGDLFESFRYRFQFPVDGGTQTLPMIFERYLRPGDYRLLVRVRDLASGRYYREERDLHVPLVSPGPRVAAEPALEPRAPFDAERAFAPMAPGEASSLLEEANATLAAGDQTLRLLPPVPGLLVGNSRIEAVATGESIARVRFLLNDRQVMSKRTPPYSVELQLGSAPRAHRVAAVAVDEDGREVARDEIVLNSGPHRFAVRLVEPRRGGAYRTSVRARAEVDVPEGESLERVEFFLNETRVATLYQPPFIQPIVIPEGLDLAYVQAVAYLADGNKTEDLVFVNAPDIIDEVNVQFVELYTTVVDRRGRPFEGLTQADFRVREDGVEQEVRRFEKVTDIPIYAGVLLDTSASMSEELDQAVKAALSFFETVVTPKDRAAVITFSDHHDLAVRFTNNLEVLAGGVAGVVADGETNLYDSLIYALYYFAGIKGKRAIILLSDGEDVGSHYRFDDVLDYARRTGVAVYTVGMGLPAGARDIQIKLSKLAEETGGRPFLIEGVHDLDRVYRIIEEELRSQYLIAYQSSNHGDDEKFRIVEVEVSQPGLEAKTMRGYYP